MKNNIIKICLFSAAILLAGTFVAQAAGFISYEDNNKIIVWDPLRLAGFGLKMSNSGVNDLGNVPDGVIMVDDKDLYLRSFMGFDCDNYPEDVNSCRTKIGDIGGTTFLSIDTLKGEYLSLLAPNSGIILDTPNNIYADGQIILEVDPQKNNNNNLILLSDTYKIPTSGSYIPEIESDINSVFVNNLFTKDFTGDTLDFPDLRFEDGAFFNINRVIRINL